MNTRGLARLLGVLLVLAAAGAAGADAFTPTELGGLRQYLLAHPERVPRLVRADPVQVEGRIRGYRLYPGAEPDLFNRLGLQPGDVVTHLNGLAIVPGNRALLIAAATFASRVNITLIRDGHRRVLEFRLR